MKTLVTGASGFIGSSVVRVLLGRGREVRCFVEPGAPLRNLDGLDVEIVTGDVNDRGAVGAALAGCDTLFHLAAIYAIWLPDPSRMYEVNVEGTKTVLWAAFKRGLERVVFTSSIAAVGWPSDGRVADESCGFTSDDWRASDAYRRSKWLSEREALRFAAEGLPLVVVNPAFPFGERDLGPTPTGAIILGVLRRKIPGYVGDAGFCAIDVANVAEGHVLAAEKGRVGERYILGDHNISYRDFFREVARAAGVEPPSRRLPAGLAVAAAWALEQYADRVSHKPPFFTYKASRYTSRKLYFDPGKARRELGLPSTPLDETLTRAVRWFRENGYAGSPAA